MKDCIIITILVFLLISLTNTIMGVSYEEYGLTATSPWWTRFTYHYVHASFLHWLLNATVLLTLAFRADIPLWQWIVTFLIASMYPQQDIVPIVGASVWIYALCGAITPVTSKPWLFFFENLVLILFGVLLAWMADIFQFASIAWLAHLYAYIAGLLLGVSTQPIYKI